VAVSECEVRSSGHRGDILPAGCVIGRKIREHLVPPGVLMSLGGDIHVLVRDFVAEPARARVYHHNYLILEKAESLSHILIEDSLDALDFDKVISAAERTELVAALLHRGFRNRTQVCGQAAVILD